MSSSGVAASSALETKPRDESSGGCADGLTIQLHAMSFLGEHSVELVAEMWRCMALDGSELAATPRSIGLGATPLSQAKSRSGEAEVSFSIVA